MGFFDSLAKSIVSAADQSLNHKRRAEGMSNQEIMDAYPSSNDKWEKAALYAETKERYDRMKGNK